MKKGVLFWSLVFLSVLLYGQEKNRHSSSLQMPAIYADNMILQRNAYLKIQGIAGANEKITVKIGSQKHHTIASGEGKWQVTLNPLKEGKVYTLNISSSNQILSYKNILAGEVWLCSGQSNMAFPLNQDAAFKNIKKNINNPNIRFFNMKPRWETSAKEWDKSVLDSLNRFEYYKKAHWEECTEESASAFSAVAYYFGKMLSDSLNVPIGLIHNAVGGSPIESWIDRQTLECQFPEILKNWMKNDLIQDWARDRAELNIKKSDDPKQRHPYEPGYLFESGITSLAAYPIRGVIWYQGESNAHNIGVYEKLFQLFIDSWRKNWENPELPFYYVQLSSLNRPSWPHFRDSQRKIMDKIPSTYMAVSSDRGDSLDVHPRQKKDIGERLAFWALNKSYNHKHVVPSGPLYRSVEYKNNYALVTFDYSEGLHASDDLDILGFEVAEADELYYPAYAHSDGDQLKVWSEKVKNPKYVRYGWQPFTRANLVNSSNLPASTFKTENNNNSDMKEKTVEALPDYPVKGGVSAPFVGVHNHNLIVAGGCNFPDTPAWKGGQKEFYNDIYYLDISNKNENSQWVKGGNLPYPVAYGAYVVTQDGIICIGGQNKQGAINAVTRIYFDESTQKIKVEELLPLPVAIFNAGATIIKNTIYITGGISSDGKSNQIYVLNLDEIKTGWKCINTNQEYERQQPVVFSHGVDLFMAGGYDEKNAKVFTDVSKFSFSDNKWYHFSDIEINESTRTFIGAAGLNIFSSHILFVGGVNYELFLSALQRIKNKQKAIFEGNTKLVESLQKAGEEYMTQPVEWYKFNQSLLLFDMKNKEWKSFGDYPQLARAGAGIAVNDNELYIICGEVKPGVRTTEVNKIMIKK